jgi:DNA-binding SARP family transcriptional activator/ABC-type transport system substrate-binding protein
VEFAVLGRLEVRIDGRAVPLGGPKQRALLALLLLNANEVVSRDRLIDRLWGERPPGSAQRSLDSYVSRLRALLGADRIERRAPGYLLNVEPGELDLARFEELLEQGRSAAARRDAAAARDHLRDALALWRGRPLADLEYEPFAGEEAARLEERRLLALEARIDAELDIGGGSELVSELERLVAEQPFRERLLGQLMTALYRAGRQADALAAFRAGRQRLSAELGLEPSPDLRELQQRILEHDPALGAVGSPSSRASPRIARGRALAAALALAVAASVVAGIKLGTGGSNASTARGSVTGVFELTGHSSVAGASLTDAPTAMVADATSIWLAEPSAGAIVRVDLASRRVEDTVPLDGSPSALAVGARSVWAATVPGNTIYRIDRATERVADRIRLPGDASVAALAYGFGRLWVADPHGQELLAYDPATDRPARRPFGIDVDPSALAAGAGGIWIADYEHGQVEEVDPRSGADLGTNHVGAGPAAIAVGDGAVWVANSLDNSVSRIDPASDTPGPAIPVGNDPVALAVSGQSVSVANEYASTVWRIDARRNAVVQTTPIGGGPTALTAAGGRIWVGTRALGAHRGGTLRLLFQRPLSQDTALQEDVVPLQSDGLTNDALFAVARVGVSQQIVPDLALSVPAPTNGETTWTFRLRHVPYSDGRFVQPEDVRRAIERLFRVRAGWSFNFTDIVGADKCTVLRCDLSRGIVVDDAHRTITFHLTRPDPGLPGKMTLPGTDPVPPGTPWHDVGFTPIPGTGPYMVASANAHEIRYVRNPRFHEWSHAAQPDGNADVIVMRYGLSPSQEVREIEQGKADWSADGVPGNLLPEVVRRFPGQWHSLTAATDTDWLQLNTNSPPFNDIRVRKALNLAIDRAAIVRMYGGPVTATPTCEVIPPGLRGYRPYCPYTRRPGDGRWHAPDLAHARALVAASGTRGDRVTAYGGIRNGTICTAVMPYVVRVLRELGYRAQAHFVPRDSLSEVDWKAVQMGCTAALDQEPADFFSNFGCGSVANNEWFCDRRFDADVLRARMLEGTDPRAANALLKKLDREVTDRAIFLPIVNPHFYDFVSARVKNYVGDPQFGLVVDQASLR